MSLAVRAARRGPLLRIQRYCVHGRQYSAATGADAASGAKSVASVTVGRYWECASQPTLDKEAHDDPNIVFGAAPRCVLTLFFLENSAVELFS